MFFLKKKGEKKKLDWEEKGEIPTKGNRRHKEKQTFSSLSQSPVDNGTP